MSDEIQLLREFRADIPDMDPGEVQRIYQRATSAEPSLRSWFRIPRGRMRYAVALTAIAAAAAGASLPHILDSHPSANHSVIPRPNPSLDELGVPAVPVSGVKDADALLPFEAVLPSNATAADMQVGDPKMVPPSQAWLSAEFDTDDGHYQLFERATDATVSTLQGWAEQAGRSCAGCTVSDVMVVQEVHVLVVSSPALGLQLLWVRGDGTSPVLTQLVWPSGQVSEQAALSVARNLINQSG